MRLEGKGAPDAANTALAEAGGLGQRARGPVGCVPRLRFQGACQDPLHFVIAQFARRAGARFIEQSVETLVEESLPPLTGGGQRNVQPTSNLGVTTACGTQQHDARTQGQRLGRLGAPDPFRQLRLFGSGQLQRE